MRLLLVCLLALVVLAVLAPVLIWSVADQWFAPALWPQALGLRGFRALASSGVGPATVASVAIAAASAGLATALAYPAGRALGLSDFRGKSALRVFLFSPVLFPPMAAALGMHSSFIRLGLADTSFGVVLAHVVPALPYAIGAIAAAFERFDPRYEDVARTLGASRLRVLGTVTLPLVWPGLAVGALFAFLVSWSQYALTLVIGGGVVITLPVLLFGLASGGDLQVTAAACVAFLIPVLLLTPITARALQGTRLGGRG